MWENICRLCSSRGDYDIFSIIPVYLHASPNEFLLWQKPINKLLEETTGLTINEEDGLPNKMCALCISYLKHAATFRQQAIDNAISLKTVLALNGKNSQSPGHENITKEDVLDDKDSILFTANDLIFSDERKTDANRLVNLLNNENSKTAKSDGCTKNFLLSNVKTGCSSKNIKNNRNVDQTNILPPMDDIEVVLTGTNLKRQNDKDNNLSARKNKGQDNAQTSRQRSTLRNNLSAIFNGISNETSDPLGEDYQTESSDENEVFEHKSNIFSYREKNFEEDDVMDLDELKEANITVNIPETCKERKCRACFRRFMFEDSYKEHMNVCIEYKFLLFIEEINRLLDIRRNKAISPHEFIRRMIFCIRKTCQWLKSTCGEMLLPELLIDPELTKRPDSVGKNSTVDILSSGANSDEADVNGKKSNFLGEILPDFFLNQVTDNQQMNNINFDENMFKKTPDQCGIMFNESLFKIPSDSRNEFEKSKKFENILAVIDRSTKKDVYQNDLKELKDNETRQKHCDKVSENCLMFFQRLKNGSLPQSYIEQEEYKQNNSKSTSLPSFDDRKMSASCNSCNLQFKSLGGLEEHNANFHNKPASTTLSERDQIIALFSNEREFESTSMKKNN